MSLKSSLADPCPIGSARCPKNAANADSTWPVTASSLSVRGNRSNSSNSGSLEQSEAEHSARMMRRIASRTAVRVPSE